MTYFFQKFDYQVSTKLDRLRELRNVLGGTQRDFAQKWGIDQPSLSKIEKGERNIGRNLSKSIINAFNLNPIWWEMGQGDMFLDPEKIELKFIDEDDYEPIILPYYPVRVQGGLIEMTDPESNYGEAEKIRVFVRKGESIEGNVVFEIDGDSMYPKYSRGTKIRCKRVKKGDWEYISSGVYAISYGDSFVVKRIKDNELSSKGILTLHSDNPSVGGSTPIPVDQLRHIWKVLRIIDSPAD
jgi:phage repressor protein C with HTH and peptisase S24 domain